MKAYRIGRLTLAVQRDKEKIFKAEEKLFVHKSQFDILKQKTLFD